MKRIKIGKGIYQDAHGITARARLGSTRTELLELQERFSLGTDLAEIRTWQARSFAALHLTRRSRTGPTQRTRSTFRSDISLYLRTAELTPITQQRRTQQLGWWADQVGDDGRPIGERRRYTLTAPELARVIKRLPSQIPGTRNKYWTAARHLWTVLDGKSAPNPLNDVPRLKEADALPRGLDYTLLRYILTFLPPRTRKSRKSVVRLLTFVYAPVTPAQIARIQPDDLDLDGPQPSILVRGRRKGNGAPPQRKPLTPDAVAVLREFRDINAFGAFASAGIRNVWVLARNRAQVALRAQGIAVDLSEVRCYDIRHSFGSLVFTATNGNMAAVSGLLDHQNSRTSQRYTLAAVPAHLQQASDAVAAYLKTCTHFGTAENLHSRLAHTQVKIAENTRKTLQSSTLRKQRRGGESQRIPAVN